MAILLSYEQSTEFRTVPVPQAILDRFLPVLGEAELKCLLYIIRHTLGYHKTADYISLTQFEQGIVGSDGTRVDAGTGCGRKAIMTALKSLAGRELIMVTRTVDKGRNATNHYTLNSTAFMTEQNYVEQARSRADSTPVPEDSSITPLIESVAPLTHEDPERKKEKPVSLPDPNPQTDPNTSVPEPDLHSPSETNDTSHQFKTWWCAAIAAHTGHRRQTHLSPADNCTLDRWYAKGGTDDKLIPFVAALLAADTQKNCFALAYFDHQVRQSLRSPVVAAVPSTPGKPVPMQSGRLRPANLPSAQECMPTPGDSRAFAPPRARLLRCQQCQTIFSRTERDPCLLRMSELERRKWEKAHVAEFHRAVAPSDGTQGESPHNLPTVGR